MNSPVSSTHPTYLYRVFIYLLSTTDIPIYKNSWSFMIFHGQFIALILWDKGAITVDSVGGFNPFEKNSQIKRGKNKNIFETTTQRYTVPVPWILWLYGCACPPMRTSPSTTIESDLEAKKSRCLMFNRKKGGGQTRKKTEYIPGPSKGVPIKH